MSKNISDTEDKTRLSLSFEGDPFAEKSTESKVAGEVPRAKIESSIVERKNTKRPTTRAKAQVKAVSPETTQVFPILVLEKFFPHRARHKALGILGLVLFAALVISGASFFLLKSSLTSLLVESESILNIFQLVAMKTTGLFLIIFPFWLGVYALESFYRSLYFHNRDYKAYSGDLSGAPVVSEVIDILHNVSGGDVLEAFVHSQLGGFIMLRSGLGYEEIDTFLSSRSEIHTASLFEIKEAGVISVRQFGEYLYDHDTGFSHFLFSKRIQKDEFLGAVSWVMRHKNEENFRERWWSRDFLGKIQGIGKDWAYGGAYILDKYGSDITGAMGFGFDADYLERRGDNVSKLEAILSKRSEANALIVGDEGVGKMDVVLDFARRVSQGTAPSSLEGKRIVLLDANVLLASTKEKGIFEEEFLKILSQSITAGNIVLVFDNLPAFLLSAENMGVDITSLMDPYLQSPNLQVIGLSETGRFHQHLEANPEIMRRFDKILIEEPGLSGVVSVLEDTAVSIESQDHVFFTYPALLEVARSADYYITDGVMPDKAIDLLVELAPIEVQRGNEIVMRDDVLDYVKYKTKVPVGRITSEEKDKLQRLEETLHERVIGQDKAITILSKTIRRARAGVRDPKKPIGSFLFLGPTGVGKTETSKALASVFFDSEDAMARIDMSEYQSPDALERMIGSFDTGKVGTLTSILKEMPYGVLLLDEFEKTNKDVHDLFLQILDEGFFSDMGGRKVSTRNVVFIATSNAGSDLIWKASQEGKDVTEIQDTLVNTIIERGIYRPEFLNRFDGVIIFHPLKKEHLEKIARIMLQNLAKRLEGQGYQLVINDPLVSKVVELGYDPAFGARPMARAIKENIEQAIAEKIIAEAVSPGDKIVFTDGELE